MNKKANVLFLIIITTYTLLFTNKTFSANPTFTIINTIFGSMQVDDPLVLEILGSPGFTRLKDLDQSGPLVYVIDDFPKYSRYDHSIGVYHLLVLYGASYEEQIAGLLHDASHTAFSHVAEHIYSQKNEQNSYQDDIHMVALDKLGIKDILEKYKFNFAKIDHKKEDYYMLEQHVPNLCADRIEYLLHTGLIFGIIDGNSVKNILSSLHYKKSNWYFANIESARILANLSLHFTEGLYAAPWNWYIYSRFSEIILQGFKDNIITSDEFHNLSDKSILSKLKSSKNAKIIKLFELCKNHQDSFEIVKDKYDFIIKPKFRGIDPFVLVGNQLQRLTSMDLIYATRYKALLEKLKVGFKIKYTSIV